MTSTMMAEVTFSQRGATSDAIRAGDNVNITSGKIAKGNRKLTG